MKKSPTRLLLATSLTVLGVVACAHAADVAPFAPDSSNSWAFPAEHPDPAEPSPMDLRSLNEPQAGENGPLTLSPDGNDLLYADGRRFVGWMVHMPTGLSYDATSNAWSLDDYRTSARFLARYGVNLGVIGVIHPAAGQANPLAVSPVVLETLHRSIAANREAGIYTQLRVGWFHGIQGKALGIAGHEEKDLQCLVFYHPRVQEAWKAWTRQLLTAVNPHTQVAMKDDPSLFSVEIVNEDSLLFYVTDGIVGDARHELERQFAAWCIRQYGSLEKTQATWDGHADPADAPDQHRLGLVKMWMLTRDGRASGQTPTARINDQLAFLVETMAEWNREARRFIREELGAKHVLVAGSNFVPADRVTMDDALRLLGWAGMDLIENNHYFDAGGKPRIAGWRADAGGFFGLRSAARDPLGLPTNKRQVEGKPFVCTEILWPAPHPYEVEGPLLVAAYQSLNGIDGLAWAGPRDITWDRLDTAYFPFFKEDGQMAMRPFACGGPATVGQFPAAAAIARLGLIKPADPVVFETRTREQILRGDLPVTAEQFAFDPTQFARGQAQNSATGSDVAPEVFLSGPVRVTLAETAAEPKLADVSGLTGEGVVRSVNGELAMDTQRGLFTADAPAARAAVGFLADAGPIELSGVRITSTAAHGTVAVVALDAKPIHQSRKILIQVGTRSVPSGWKESPGTWDENGVSRSGLRIDATGTLPWRVTRAKVSVEFDRLTATAATAMNGNGQPGAPVPLLAAGKGIRIDVPEDCMYVVME